MGVKIWSNVLEKGGCIFGIDAADIFLFTVRGGSSRTAIKQIQQRIVNGQAPRTIDDAEAVVIPIAALNHIQTREDGTSVEVYYHDSDARDLEQIWFMPKNDKECEGIAREIADSTGRNFVETRSDVSLASALVVPIIATVVAALVACVLYLTASSIDAGEGVVAQGTRRGLKQLVIWIASVLGVHGSILVGSFLVAVSLLWLVKNVIKRPQILTLQFVQKELGMQDS